VVFPTPPLTLLTTMFMKDPTAVDERAETLLDGP
jgi:hypothetical protein